MSSPFAPSPLASINSSGMLTVHSPEAAGHPGIVHALAAQAGERSALVLREGERSALALREGEELNSGVLNQRTGMFLLALFSCFLLFNPGSRRPPPHMDEPGTPMNMNMANNPQLQVQHPGVLNTLAEAAIKSENDTSSASPPLVQIKNEPLPLSHEQMAAFLAASGHPLDPALMDPTVRIPLVVDAQGLLHEWLVTADEHAMAQLRALTYEPLVRALGPEIANRAIREFAASFARQLD
jgi:hypothetical protein